MNFLERTSDGNIVEVSYILTNGSNAMVSVTKFCGKCTYVKIPVENTITSVISIVTQYTLWWRRN